MSLEPTGPIIEWGNTLLRIFNETDDDEVRKIIIERLVKIDAENALQFKREGRAMMFIGFILVGVLAGGFIMIYTGHEVPGTTLSGIDVVAVCGLIARLAVHSRKDA